MNSNRPPSLRRLLIACAACLTAGCASAPIQQMSDARQSLQAAHAAHADVHAPGLLKKAESDLSDAELSLVRHQYGQARKSAVKARQEAVSAAHIAVAIRHAKQAAEIADMLGLSDERTTASLDRIRTEAASTDQPQALLRRAQDITLHLNERINRYYLDKAKPMIDALRKRRGAMNERQRRLLKEAEQAYREHHGKSAYDGISILLQDLKSPAVRPRREPPPATGTHPSMNTQQVLRLADPRRVAAAAVPRAGRPRPPDRIDPGRRAET